MQWGTDLTDLLWRFVFISHVVTDEFYSKIPTDCRGCRNDPFFVRGRKHKQKREREKSYFSAFYLSGVSVHAYKGRRSPLLSAVLAHRGTEWRWPAWELLFRISEPQGVPLCAILFIWPESKGEVAIEVSLVPFPASWKDLRWPLPLVSQWTLNWGTAWGFCFSWSSSTVSCSQRHLWEKLILCVCKQISEWEMLLPCWRSDPKLHPNLPSYRITITSWRTPKHRDSFEDKVAGIGVASWSAGKIPIVPVPLSSLSI